MIDNHPHRKEKILEILGHAAAEFILREANQNSMITVTSVRLSTDFQRADIFVTVFPEDSEEKAMDFLKRNLNEFREFVKSETRLQHIPWFNFLIDVGEKKRQRIDDLTKEI
ncbi:MAG TPA: ribosome-binding factor A [Candidatus Paceibacterota bacterium]|nr:ribosome-binding factor A [Candidatus Paceibacterota bacterium]